MTNKRLNGAPSPFRQNLYYLSGFTLVYAISNPRLNAVTLASRLKRLLYGALTIALPILIFMPCLSYAQEDNVTSAETSADSSADSADIPSDTLASSTESAEVTTCTDDDAVQEADSSQNAANATAQIPENTEVLKEHKIRIAPFPVDYVMKGQIVTSLGTLECELYAGTHPLTVLNFVSLGRDGYGWTDASGVMHQTAYYSDLPFDSRVKGAYVTSSVREEGTNFVLEDERCAVHQPTSGSIVMIQNHPGMASTQFALLARTIPQFKGMYVVFGHCEPLDLIDKLTRENAVIERLAF